MSIKSFLLASLQQPAPWLSPKPLYHQLFRQRKRKRVEDEDCLFPPRSRICTGVSPLLALKLSGEFVPLRQERAFWSIHPPQDCEGTWETEVKGTWAKVGLKKPEKEEEKFMERYRLNLPTFQSLVNIIGPLVAKANTLMRSSICPEKRIAVFLHWMAHGEEYHELASSYRVGTSTVHSIIHEILPIACSLASKEIVFPTEVSSLVETVRGFELLSGLPGCCGAIDGTFMHINKPVEFGDAYYCYKQYPALLIFACVTSRGLITYVKTGIPGAVGDASSYNTSKLKENIDSGHWLAGMRVKVENTKIPLFLVGDAAFSFSTRLMKCYAVPAAQQTNEQKAFNYALIRTRRVVENAFGRLKARWRILVSNFIRDADFAGQVSLAACVLHNICERSACPFDTKWLVDIEAVRTAGNTTQLHAPNPQEQHPAAEQIRSILARRVKNTRRLPV